MTTELSFIYIYIVTKPVAAYRTTNNQDYSAENKKRGRKVSTTIKIHKKHQKQLNSTKDKMWIIKLRVLNMGVTICKAHLYGKNTIWID